MKLAHFVCALACCGAAALPAFAEVRVHNTISTVSYSLQDLSPEDGIVPALSSRGGATGTHLLDYVSTSQAPFHFYQKTHYASHMPPVPQLFSHVDDGRQIAARFDGTLFGSDLSASRTAMPMSPGQDVQVSRNEMRFYFELTPQSALTFHTRLEMGAFSDEPVKDKMAASAGWIGYATLSTSPYSSIYLFESLILEQGETEDALSRDVTLVLRNTGDQSVFGSFTMYQGVRVDAVAAIPEPATWGMLLSGLALLGVRVRRRQGAR